MIARPDTIRKAIAATEDVLYRTPVELIRAAGEKLREEGETIEDGRARWRRETINRLNALNAVLETVEVAA